MSVDWLKDKFAYFYKRFTWGYAFIQQGVAMFNFIGILAILIGNKSISRWIYVPILMVAGFLFCVFIGWLMFDRLKFKTKFTAQEGFRDDYWTHKLTPVQQKMLLVYLDAVKNPKKLGELKKKVEGGVL